MTRLLRCLAVVMLSVASALLVFACIPTKALSIDFEVYYGAGQRLLDGLSPYALYGQYSLPFQYLPWFAWPFVLVAPIPPMTAQHVHSAVILATTLAAIVILLRALRWSPPPTSAVTLGALALVAIRFVLTQGQICHVQLLAVAVSIWALANDRPILAGLTAPILLVKPHLMAIYLPALLWRAGRRARASTTASVGILTITAFLLEPQWPMHLWESAMAAWLRPVAPGSWRFVTLMGALGLPRLSNIAIVLFWPAGALCLWRLRRLDSTTWLTLALVLSLTLTPYALAYDVLLIVPVFVYLSHAKRSHLIWCTLDLMLMTAIGPRGPMYVGVLIPLALLLRDIRAILPRAMGGESLTAVPSGDSAVSVSVSPPAA